MPLRLGSWILCIPLLGLPAGCVMETRYEPPTILFMGNSITLATKNDSVGWTVPRGMAASVPDKDYVHQTLRILKENGLEARGVIGATDCVTCDGPINWHRENLWQVKALRPRYVVVQLGENSDIFEIKSGKLMKDYLALLEGLRENGAERILCVSDWDEGSLRDPHNDAILKAIRTFGDARLVDITAFAANPANRADTSLFANVDIRWHPGDAGMALIAEALAKSILADR